MRARWLIVAAIVVLACAGTLSLWFVRGGSPELSVEDEARVDAIVEAAMSRSTTTGLSLAIAHQGRLVFAKAYGAADRGEPLTTKHRFRLASVSKPLTAIEIMRLVDGGRLRLDDRVFGDGAVLGERYVASSRFADPRVRSITVGQLLEHTAGGWDNDAQDGTLDPLIVQPRLDRDRWLSWILRNVKLEHEPGTVFQYSNFGYAVLGRVIEQVTRRSYAETMRADVFRPARAESFALAGGSRSERLPGEVAYTQVGAHTDAPYELPLERMDAHGGWVATPTDLLRVAVRADGFTDVADLLSSMALATMTTPGMARAADGRPADYAKGWAVNDVPNWWHTGDLPGTSSLLVRTANRYGSSGREAFTWAAITNSTNAQPRAALNLDELMWRIVRSVEAWPDGDGI